MNKTVITLSLAAISAAAAVTACTKAQAEPAPAIDIDHVISDCHKKVERSIKSLKDADGNIDYMQAPRNIAPGDTKWAERPVCAEEWCSGFWPGVLWMDYEATGDEEIEKQARAFTASIKTIVDKPLFDHDLGFLVLNSYGKGYECTKDPEYRRVMLSAADSLAKLYNPKVGTLLSWPRNVEMFGGHNTIMDNMINLELLFWAARNGGDHKLYDIAVSHADTTMAYHFRPDGTCYHVAVYDPESGDFKRGCTHQGYADSSTWARGQAWAIYGYTMVYRETKDPKYLAFAQKVTDAYLSMLPDDKVPYWDFNDPTIPQCSKDASAACVVASALLELKDYVGEDDAARYKDEAESMLMSLTSDGYWSADNDSFLLHSTGHRPAGSEIDYSIVYADYYFYEAMLRLKK
ncbi:MAG: glycoside hydrolase family 88 protein [Clostridium sp.]|nr:glycoside hydrolase family 88 protein [Clostridium sp.]